MPPTEVRLVSRASSPSAQSQSSPAWTSTTAMIAVASPPKATTTPPATPHRMKASVTALGDRPSRVNTQVARGDSLRMYSRPNRCSSLTRSTTHRGWPSARTSSSVGRGMILRSRWLLRLGNIVGRVRRVQRRSGVAVGLIRVAAVGDLADVAAGGTEQVRVQIRVPLDETQQPARGQPGHVLPDQDLRV